MSRDDDLLERATRALRATPPPTDGELAQARLRMLAAHQAAKKGSRRTLRWVLPLAAVLAAGSALAAVPHGLDRLASAVSRFVGFELLASEPRSAQPSRVATHKLPAPASQPVASPSAEPAPSAEPTPSAEPALVANPAVSAPVAGEPAPEAVSDAVATRAVVRAPRSKRREPTQPVALTPSEPRTPHELADEPPAPLASADLAKYRAAHKAHFQQRDFALALRAWEAYLRQFPNGTFAVEARYNRAICLLRLGRNDEARRALTPFAKGELANGYRQAEATKLLQALE